MSAKRHRTPAPARPAPDAAARELEQLAATYPEDREEILLEAADAWCEAGEHDRALRLYERLLADESTHPHLVAAYRVGALFDAGREAEAREAARELRGQHPHDALAWHYVGESFEAADDPHTAADWFTAGITHALGPTADLTADLVETGPPGLDMLLTSRHRVRRLTGDMHDDWDAIADQVHAQGPALLRGTRSLDELHSPQRLSPDEDTDLDALRAEHARLTEQIQQRRAALHTPEMTCALFWPQQEFTQLLARWPAFADEYGTDHTHHLRRVEQLLRTYSDSGMPRLGTARGTVDDFTAYARDENQDPAAPGLRASYAADLAARGQAHPWPPPRNGPCWCGADRKYKKCHGNPALA
ncbi:SEC-C domain-containing protein [Streptomyces mirabilis]|uniref:SEC-C domain-containing protein n=1 Tax=Streptomyces mirabilis TaxID=68239 RepID=UPI0032447083